MAFNLFNNVVGAVQNAGQNILASSVNRLQEAQQSAISQIGNEFFGNAQSSLQSNITSALGANNPLTGIANNLVSDVISNVKGNVESFFNASNTPSGLNSAVRSANLLNSKRLNATQVTAEFKATADGGDWRVKLSLPTNISEYQNSNMLAPLNETGGFCWPYTPTIILGHSANYNSLHPVHSNHPFQVYENSQVDDIMITGDFTVQTQEEGRYWIAAVHYLRSLTKMFYGNGENLGAPPPVIRLNGYGDYVFKDVPVVITNFTVDMQGDVDYVAVNMSNQLDANSATAWAPTQSLISVTLRPTYSRNTTSSFNLSDFVNGNYVTNGQGFI